MPICPQGHDSPAADYCDYCGWPMPAQAAQPQQQPQQQWGAPEPAPQPPQTTGLEMCPICSTPQTGRYCEECGYDYDLASPPPASRSTWRTYTGQPISD